MKELFDDINRTHKNDNFAEHETPIKRVNPTQVRAGPGAGQDAGPGQDEWKAGGGCRWWGCAAPEQI